MKRAALLLLFLLLTGFVSSGEEKRTFVPLDDSPSTGPAAAPVTIVEFIDFQ